MALQFRRGRDGELRPWWYGEFVRSDGRRAVENLGVPFEGKPPESGRVADNGNAAFKASRTRALMALETLQYEAQKGRMTKSAAFRQYKERTGEPLKALRHSELLATCVIDKRTRSIECVKSGIRRTRPNWRASTAWSESSKPA